MVYKVARYIREGDRETAKYEEKRTGSIERAKKLYDKWKEDQNTTRLCIWESKHGSTNLIMVMNPRN